MTCENARPAPLRCPTLPERIGALLSLLPLGRAWGSDDTAHEPAHDAAFDAAAFDPAVYDTRSLAGTIIYRFFAAVAEVIYFAETRLCDLRREFFCASAVETRDLWMLEYDLPSACDPFPDLCGKVAALGGARCEYFQEVAARAGWRIECDKFASECGDYAGCAYAGTAIPGPRGSGVFLRIFVYLNDSPSYGGGAQTPSLAGQMFAGIPLTCEPDLSPLRCLIERIVHAHIKVEYSALN